MGDQSDALSDVSDTSYMSDLDNLQSDQFEHIWVDIKIFKSLDAVNVWYRPPLLDNHDEFMIVSENILFQLQTYNSGNKIILSDFNFVNC